MELFSHLLFFVLALSTFWILVRAPGNLLTSFINLFRKKKTDDYLDEIKEKANPKLNTLIGLVIWLALMYFGVQMLPKEKIANNFSKGLESKIEKQKTEAQNSEAYKSLEEASRLVKQSL